MYTGPSQSLELLHTLTVAAFPGRETGAGLGVGVDVKGTKGRAAAAPPTTLPLVHTPVSGKLGID